MGYVAVRLPHMPSLVLTIFLFEQTLSAFIQQSYADAQARKKLEKKIQDLETTNRVLLREAKRMQTTVNHLLLERKVRGLLLPFSACS